MTTLPYGPKPWQLTGRAVLFGLLAFFAVVASVNATFIYFALSTWPGLSSQDAYSDGLNYNEVLDEARRQEALGWHSEVEMDRAGQLTLRLANQAGTPVNGLTVDAVVTRPLGEARELHVALTQALDGSYRGVADLPAPGQWRVQIAAARGDGARYRMDYDVMVRP